MNVKKRIIIITTTIILLGVATVIVNLMKDTNSNRKYKIGLVQIVEHKSLNLIRDSFLDRLVELGYDTNNLNIMQDCANGEVSLLSTIMQKYESNNMDIIVPIATPTAVAAAQYAYKIPIVFSAVSDPIGAGLTNNLEKPDKGITGCMDSIAVNKIYNLMIDMFPNIRKIGFIYNSSESNSQSTISEMKRICSENGIEFVEANVAVTSELTQAINGIINKVDAVFSPIDNTVASGISVVSNTCIEAKKPFFVSADSMVFDNGFATVGIDYKRVGIETADIVDRVLKGEKVDNIPIKTIDDGYNIYVNEGVAERIGYSVPKSIKNANNYVPVPFKE